MSDVLIVSTCKLGHPVVFSVDVIAGDGLPHSHVHLPRSDSLVFSLRIAVRVDDSHKRFRQVYWSREFQHPPNWPFTISRRRSLLGKPLVVV